MKNRFFSLSSVLLAFAVVAALLFATSRADAQMSDTEKKAAARAAYQEGVKLQDDGKFADALVRFESAQKLFDAPTHLLHIAECQALTGRLVEASETYETLARKTLPPGSPDAFTQAQQQGQAELSPLRARIPTLRVTTKPGPQQIQNLQVNVNGVSMPNELLGIARPLNPGTYRFQAQGVGWQTAAPIDVPLGEKEQKSVELTLNQVQGGGAVVVQAPPPAPYGNGNPDRPQRPRPAGPTSAGLLLGVHGGAVIPTGDVAKNVKFDQLASGGGGGGIDLYARLAKALLLGGQFEYASLGAPKTVTGVSGSFDASASSTFVSLNIGYLPNVDKVSFIIDGSIGSRTASRTLKSTSGVSTDFSVTGLELGIAAGVSIPAGPIRLVPKLGLTGGSFSSGKANGVSQSIQDTSGHIVLFFGLAAFYSLDFGSKPEPEPIQ
jgi:hypothetical protein